jgi:hypothetical protein
MRGSRCQADNRQSRHVCAEMWVFSEAVTEPRSFPPSECPALSQAKGEQP